MSSTSNLSTDITALIQEYYDRRALLERGFDSGLLKYAKPANIPRNQSKVAHWHRWQKFALAETVTEAAEPADPIQAAVDEVTATMEILSSRINIPQDGDDIRIDSLTKESYPKFTEQLERTANRKLITALGTASTGATFRYCGGKNSFADLAAGDVITSKDIQRAVGYLEQNGVPKINGSYVCLLNPWAKVDLLAGDSEFRDLLKTGSLDVLQKNNLDMWAGARIAGQDEPFRETLGGTEGTYSGSGSVGTVYIFGRESYGSTQLMGKTGLKPRFKVQDITATGSVMTIGWRCYYAGAILNRTWVVALKHVMSDASVTSVA